MSGYLRADVKVDVSVLIDAVKTFGGEEDLKKFKSMIGLLPTSVARAVYRTHDFDSLMTKVQGLCDWVNRRYFRGEPIHYITAIHRCAYDEFADLVIEAEEESMEDRPRHDNRYVWYAKSLMD